MKRTDQGTKMARTLKTTIKSIIVPIVKVMGILLIGGTKFLVSV
jgi:hypothetical protein